MDSILVDKTYLRLFPEEEENQLFDFGRKCEMCERYMVVPNLLEVRAADEGGVEFFRCLGCKHATRYGPQRGDSGIGD